MIGFVLPLCEETDFPMTEEYVVRTLGDIEGAFTDGILSHNAYVFMAQPLTDKASAFSLVIFGSDNKFTYKNVIQRWKHIQEEAKKHGIEIEGFSSDGDTRCLKSMKLISKLGSKLPRKRPANAADPRTHLSKDLAEDCLEDSPKETVPDETHDECQQDCFDEYPENRENQCPYKPYFQVIKSL